MDDLNSNKKQAFKRSNTHDITSKFSSTYSNSNEQLDPQKLSEIKNKFQPMVIHAERKLHYESMENIIKNVNQRETEVFDILKGKENPLKEKALKHLKKSNSFLANSIPFFLEEINFEKDIRHNNNILRIKKKKSLKMQNRVATTSSDVFDILNDDYIKSK